MRFLRFCRAFLVRPLRQEPVRAALTALAVALGVAVVLAIELAGRAAAGSFHASLETLVGNQDLEITAVGGVPEELFARLSALPYPLHLNARMEDFVVLEPGRETEPLIGLDLVSTAFDLEAEQTQRQSPAATWSGSRELPDLNSSVWLGAGLGRQPGEKIRLQINDTEWTFNVAGILPETRAAPEEAVEHAVVMDIGLAQRVLHRAGRLDRILVRLPSEARLLGGTERSGSRDAADYETFLARELPAGVHLARAGERTDENRKMLTAFRWNLRLLSYIALIVGAFLIYNTISVSVVRRRREIGVLRAVGATRAQVLLAFLAEAAFFGIAGTIAGIPLARAMATGAVRLMGATVESLYVSSAPAPVTLTPGILGLGFALGCGVAFISALAPALEAAGVAPVEAMERGAREYHARARKGRDALVAAVLCAAALGATVMPPVDSTPVFGYFAAAMLVLAAALAMPALVAGAMNLFGAPLRDPESSGRWGGVAALLASRSLAASLRRSAVLAGALATAVAMMASVGIMVSSFRQTVELWMKNQVPADLYLTPAIPAAADRHPTLAPGIRETVAQVPGVAAVGIFRAFSISYQGLPATLGSVDLTMVGRTGTMKFLSGDAHEIVAELLAGHAVVVSEPFANKHHLRRGDSIRLPLGEREVTFRVAGVFYDYGSEAGYVIADRTALLPYLQVDPPSNVAVRLAPGADAEQVRRAIFQKLAGRRVTILRNSEIRAQAMRIFDRTFAITYALEAIAIAVAVVGIAGALLAVVIDRRREVGLLRFLGASQPQVRRLIVFEAGLLGLVASFAGLVLGALLSLILIFVINKQSFGWTIQVHWPPALLLGATAGVYLATVLAALYPARVAARLVPIQVIHEE